jgi:hypothetical protein
VGRGDGSQRRPLFGAGMTNMGTVTSHARGGRGGGQNLTDHELLPLLLGG